jgi:anaerobic selenocysteine-containing dehydrogenase
VGSVGVDGGIRFMPRAALAPSAARTLPAALAGAVPQVLLLDEANPVHSAPPGWKVAEWLRRVPYIVSFGAFVDDTSAMADLLLPDHSFLESWTESVPEAGAAVFTATVAPPVMRPLYDTRATTDVLLEVSRRLQRPLTPAMPQTFEAMVQTPLVQEPEPPAAPPAGGGRDAAPIAWQPPTFDGEAGAFPFHLHPYPSQALLDGSLAHLPWLQELPDPLTTAMWSSWVELNARTAEQLGVRDGDIVEVASAHGTIQAPVVISPGLAPELVAMPMGQGHQTFTRYASGRGANPLALLAPLTEPATGSLAWSATRVKVTKIAAADGRLIRFAGATRERPEHTRGRG